MQATNAHPGEAELATRALEARNASEKIRATIAMLDARRAAVASSKNPKELRLLLLAGSTLKQALALGRSFAAQYPDPLGNIEQALKRLPEGHTKETLLVLVEKTRREVVEVEHQAEAFRRNLENWFNDAMDRVGGWYKRWTQRVLLILATLLVLAANADTVMLVQQLSANSALRASLVAAAEDAVRTLPRPSGAEPESSAPESGYKNRRSQAGRDKHPVRSPKNAVPATARRLVARPQGSQVLPITGIFARFCGLGVLQNIRPAGFDIGGVDGRTVLV